MLREAGLGGGGTETERYLRIAMLRFLLLQTFDWTDEIAERLTSEVKSPSAAAEKDTMTHADPQGAARLAAPAAAPAARPR